MSDPVYRPVIYVAEGSHANYFTPGVRGEDWADGAGQYLDDVEWRSFDDVWATWEGRWGASTGIGKSPESPGMQHERWDTPEIYHSRSR